MRFSTKSIVFFCLAGSLALASPIAKKFEKKSAEGIDYKTILGAEGSGSNADRAKKEASTTFCVEIKHDKPVQVDCNQAHPVVLPQQVFVQPQPQQVFVQPPPAPEPTPEPVTEPPTTTPAPTPAPAPPAQVIVVPQQPAQPPPPQVIYQQPPPQVVYQQQPQVVYQQPQPCEPEMQAYSYQPPPQVYYAPTGHCATHGTHATHEQAPTQYQAPASANPVQQILQHKINQLQNLHDKLGPQKPAVYGQQPVYQQQQPAYQQQQTVYQSQQPAYQQQQQQRQAIEPLLAALSQHSGSPYLSGSMPMAMPMVSYVKRDASSDTENVE